MKNKSILIAVIALIATGGLSFITIKNIAPVDKGNIFCSSDGTMTNIMPIQSHRSYCLRSDSVGKTYSANIPYEYSFWLTDDEANRLENFEVTHTKIMHVIIVRKDLKYFQHIHPEYDPATGEFNFTGLTFPADGEYRIFADFAPAGGMKDPMGMPLMITLFKDVEVGTSYSPESLGSEVKTKTFDSYQVTLSTHGAPISGAENMLMFSISQNGEPVTSLEAYLGALGHSVILKEGTLDFIHAHPVETKTQNGKVSFMVYLPESGRYKAFTQFQRDGKVFTTDFVISVAEGSAIDSMEDMMPGRQH